MAAIDALSRLPPLKDVETKAQGSTSALQKHREGRNVYQFLRSRPATTTSWDAGLSSAATAERSSHLSKITDQPWSPGRALPASAMQATGSRAAASTPPAMNQLPHAMHLSATAPYAVMLPGSKSSVQQQRRSPYQQAMTQRVMRKPMVSGGQAQVQAGPAGPAPGSPAAAASRQPPARVEPGHRGQWGTAAEQHLSREPAGQPAWQRSEWAGQSTEAWRSARSSEALKKETRQGGPASPSAAAALWQQGQLHRHPATSRAKDGQQQPTAEHPARSNTDPTATQPHSLLPSHHSPAFKTQSGHAPGTWAASRAAAVNPVHTAAIPAPAPHDLTIPSRRTHPSVAPGQPSLPLATSPSQATLIASLLPVGSGAVTGAVSGAVLMPGMMSGAAAWTTGQEGGGRDRNQSPGRQAGPQQLVAARSYPKFVYSYTSLAKPLATSANPVLRAGHHHPLSRSTLAASPSLPPGASLSHSPSATAHLHAAPAASTASEARLRGPGPGPYPGMSDCHPGDRLPISSGLVPNPSRITALIANAPPTIDPGLGLSSHVSALRAGHVPGTGPALTQVLSLGLGQTPDLEHSGTSLHLADAGGRAAVGLASTWAGVLQLGAPPQAHTQPLAPSPDPLHQLPQSDLAAHPTSPGAARSARLGLGAGLGHEAQGAVPGAQEGRAVSSSHTHRTWSSSTYSSNSSSARGRAAKSPAPALASPPMPLLVGKAALQAEAAALPRAMGAAGGQAVGRGVGAVPWQQGPGGEWPTLDLDALYPEDSSSPVATHPQRTLQAKAPWQEGRLEPETSYQQHQHYQQQQYQQHQSVQQHQQQYHQQRQHQRLKVMEVIQVTPVQEDGVEHLSSELGGVVEGIQEDIHRALTQQVQVKMKFKLANSKPLPKLHPPGPSAITSLPPALPPALPPGQGGTHAGSPGPQGVNGHAGQRESGSASPSRPALPPPQQHAHNPRQQALPTCHDQQHTSCMVPPHAAQPRQATPPSSHQPTSLSHHLTSMHSHFATPQTPTHQAAADGPHPSARLPPARPSSTAIVQPLAIAAAAARTPMYERRQLPVSPRPPEPPASHRAAAMSASSVAEIQEAGQKLLDSSSLPRLPANVRVDVQEAEEEAVAALNAAAAEPPTAAAPPAPQAPPSGFNSSRPPTRQGLAEALVSVGAGLANAAAQLPPPSPLLLSALGLRASARPAGRTAAATMPGSLVVCVADMAGPWAGATQAVVAGTGLTTGQAESSQILHVLYEEQSIMQLGSTPSSRPASPSTVETDTCHAVPDQATVLAQLQLPSPGLTLALPAPVSHTASLGSSSPSSLFEPLSLQSDSLPSRGAAELGVEGGSLARVVDVVQPAHGITGSGCGPHPANSTQGTAAVGGCCPGIITDSQSKADASRDSAPLPGAQEQGPIETPTGSAGSVPQEAASSSQQPSAMTAAEVVDIMADASCEPAPGLLPPTLPSSPTPSPPTPSTPHAASADHAAGEQSLPPGAYQAHVFQQTPRELQAAQAHAAMLQQVQDSFHVRRSREVDSDGLRLGLESDPAPEFAEDLPSDVDGAFADGGSDGQSARLSDEASAAALFSDGGSDDGFDDVDSGSDDGEVLSVSAYAIEPAVKLSIKPADVPARRPVPPSDNDIIDSNGMRLLGTKYEVQHMVGEGAYGKVMKCRVRGSSPEQWVAVKEFKIEDDDPDADDVKRTSRREVNLLRSLEHPNIVAFIDEFMVRDRLFIVMEFVPCNLLELLEAQPGGMDREAVRLILFQLCTAIAFIHAQHIVYRDVKPENLLINEQGHLKLCDFGFARHISPSGEDKLTDYVATRWYRAPELLLGPPYEDVHGTVQSKYGPAIDMWAIGCLMGELMDGEPLFAGDSDLDQLYRIQTVLGPVTPSQQALFNSNPHNAGIVFNFKEPLTLAARYEDRMTEVELDFLSRLLTLDPSQRITGQACLQHPYLADLGQQPLQAGQLSGRRSSSAMSGGSSTSTSLSGPCS